MTRTSPLLLVVSPHLDDAVLSVGATIAACVEAGARVVVCTVFAAQPPGPLSPVARDFHRSCGLGDDAAAVRRAEDVQAVRELGAEPHHLGYGDAVYRRVAGDWLCRHERAMFDSTPPAEPGLSARLTSDLATLITELRPGAVWTCAGIGGHVDHRLVNAAVTGVTGATSAALLTWEDLPYAIWEPAAARPGPRPGSLPTVRPHHLDRKLAAAARYPSQLGMLWPDGDWRDSLLRHARRRAAAGHGAEPLWRPAPPATRPTALSASTPAETAAATT